MKIDEATAALSSYVSSTAMKSNYTLDRMQALLAALGDPQESFMSIHIAGTSGKTSTAYFLRNLLVEAGLTVGLTVSPYISTITERVQIGLDCIDDELFGLYTQRVVEAVENRAISPTYFEVLVSIAFEAFKSEAVDYGVIETGLGGLLDGTNVIRRADKLCVITDIGFDHTEILGESLDDIAFQKAGIVQQGNIVLIQDQDPAVVSVLSDTATARGASEVIVIDGTGLEGCGVPQHLPLYQRRNWLAASSAYSVLANRDGLATTSFLNLDAASRRLPPGRMERISVSGVTFILDGAHNQQKICSLRESLELEGLKDLDVLANFVTSEAPKHVDCLRELKSIVGQLIVPDFSVIQYLGKVSFPSQVTALAARELGYRNVIVTSDLREAVANLMRSSTSRIVLVTGSLYLVAQVREVLVQCE